MRASNSPRLKVLAFALAIAPLASPIAARAQLLRGTITDSATRVPIPGAVIVLLDSTGTSLGRNITNERGEYTIALHPAMTRVQVLRIGFRPRAARIPAAVDGIVHLDITMPILPRLLEPVAVVDQPNCPRRDDRSAAFALWEQARAALLAIVVAREANPAHVTRLHYVRRLDLNDRIITNRVRIDSAATSRPFVATRSAAQFVSGGFVFDSAGAKWYNGPDADVMLDPAFVGGYCFGLAAAEPERPSQLGLRFSPATSRRGRVDIDGILWIDSTTRALTDIVFQYAGLGSRAERLRPGGKVSFRTMDNGTAIIDRWVLRSASYPPTQQRRMTLQQIVNMPMEAHEDGGEVATARWADGHEWRASLGTFRGQLADNLGAGVDVRLVDTDYRGVTDSSGRFEISHLLPGPYRIGVVDPRLGDLDLLLLTDTRFSAVRDSVIGLIVAAPTVDDYAAGLCSAETMAPSDALLVARVQRPDGTPAAGAKVEIRTLQQGSVARFAEGETDRNGLFHLCQAPRTIRLIVRAEIAGFDPVFAGVDIDKRVVTVKLRLKDRQ